MDKYATIAVLGAGCGGRVACSYGVAYWNWEFKNLAGTIETTLMEIDWLSEDAKPRFRAAALAMAEFERFVEKEVRTHQTKKNRKLLGSTGGVGEAEKDSRESAVSQLKYLCVTLFSDRYI